MALDKLVDSTQLDSDLTSVANAIRAKSGGSSQLAFPAGFVSEIGNIPSGQTIYYSTYGSPYAESLELPRLLSGQGSSIGIMEGATHLKTLICNDTRNIGGSSSSTIVHYFNECTSLETVSFPFLAGVKSSYIEYFLGNCTAMKTAVFGSVGHPISEFANTNYNKKVFQGCTQSDLTITIFVNASTLADIPTAVTTYAPWGANNATIVYKSSVDGSVLT